MKKIAGILLVLTLTSCGKNEIVSSVKKEVTDGLTVVIKAADDALNTAGKAIDDSKETADKAATDVKNEADSFLTKSKQTIDREGHNAVETIGEVGEDIGQTPRKIVNELLGTDSESDEKLASLEDQVDEFYEEFLQAMVDLSEDMDQIKQDSDEADQDIISMVEDIHTSILRKINRGDRRNLRKIKSLRRQVSDLRSLIYDVQDEVDSLEVVCSYKQFYSFYYGPYSLARTCELESQNQ